MTKLTGFVAAAALCVAVPAFAQKDAKPKDVKPVAAPEMAAPKPAAELAQLKVMAGAWNCTGTVKAMGKEMKSAGRMTFKWELDNHFLTATFEEKKSKDNPVPHRSLGLIGYDATSKMFTNMSGDNMGGVSMSTSKGWQGDKWEWSGKAKMMGMDVDLKDVITKGKNDKEVKVAGSMGAGDKGVAWDMTCTK